MKNILLVLLTVCGFALQGNAQAANYKAFEWDLLRIGYVIPGGDGVGAGLAVGGEPRFNLKDNISIGLRGEFALFGSGDESGNAELGAFSSWSVIGDYYFATDKAKRGFAGLGLGTFKSGSLKVNGQASGETGSNIGAIARVGYEMGLLRWSAEYNLIFAEGATNYLGLHLGITLFGGYKG